MQAGKTLCLRVVAVPLAAVLLAGAAGATVTPEQRCEAKKNALAGKYAACLGTAKQKLVLEYGDTYVAHVDALFNYNAAINKCGKALGQYLVTYSSWTPPLLVDVPTDWQKLEAATEAKGTTCPTIEDELAFASFLTANADATAAALHTPPLPLDVVNCNSQLAAYQSGASAPLLQTGETACYDSSGTPISCAGTGQDGELQTGIVRQYVDNGDGTITDTKTGLMWEKKSSDGSIHDRGTSYTWYDALSVFIAGLNSANFAGHNDWRLPNINELQSLVDYGRATLAIDPVFNTACVPGCTVTTCSCTGAVSFNRSLHCSSTSENPRSYRHLVWFVDFNDGSVLVNGKSWDCYVRAVRGGA